MAPPLAAMIVLLVVVAGGEISRYEVAAASQSRAGLIIAVQGLAQKLQEERAVTVAVLNGNTEFRPEIAAARRGVDTTRAWVESGLGDSALDREAASTIAALDDLAQQRATSDAGTADVEATFDLYTGLIERLSGIYRHLELVDDEGLRHGLESLEYLNEVIESTAQEQVLLNAAFTAGRLVPAEYLEFTNIVAARDLELAEFNEFAAPDVAAAKKRLDATPAARNVRAREQAVLKSGAGPEQPSAARPWYADATTVLGDMETLAKNIGAGTQHDARSLRDQAAVRLAVLATIVLLCLVGTIWLAFSGIRSLAGQLAGLAGEADRLARESLPDAVGRAVAGDTSSPPEPVRTGPDASVEVRQVAAAFARVQETAYNLATEQARLRRTSAESLANLGRRNQNLLRRQLSFITRLEQEEPNPAGLANLFELDHLATRMRRNAESLLVLVGASSPRQWSRRLPLTDVIRAAVSEVEEYRRVNLRRMDEALVQGSIASDLAHMLAELIENGLTFSPPDLDVEIQGRRLEDGYLIAISDQGIGLSEEEMAKANARLSGAGDFLTAPARFLGHHVVGRLAAEMGAIVQLTPSPVVGVTARIRLPESLVGEVRPVEAPLVEAPLVEAPPVEEASNRLRFTAPRQRPKSEEVDYVVVDEPSLSSGVHLEAEFGKPRGEHRAEPRWVQPAVAVAELPPVAAEEPTRTPNGLRKRQPRLGRPRPATATAQVVRRSEPVPDSPVAVGVRLTALRDGIQRGAAHTENIGGIS
ncbi:sensor histidine kinase [Paractinoplanes durhamensis]|uniref:sensor histidine kinase n=1 Tax=Paractinoplanes durhamensis TaxID=113563 RepID=UPI001EF23556|nr:nitrate- and nitrite sensing domain-containing protein [Actinoplanes durhamensis]